MSKTTLYRLYDQDDALLYVGISGKWFLRMAQHATEKGWWDDVVTAKMQAFPSRAEALAAETQAIRDEKPLHNVQRRPVKPPPRPRTPVRRLHERTPPPPEFTALLERIARAHEDAMLALRAVGDPALVADYVEETQALYVTASRLRAKTMLRVREEVKPTLAELAEYTGLSRARVDQIIQGAKRRRESARP